MAETEERNIIIGMDGSDHADYAFDWYIENIHRPLDHVILIHCPEYHAVVHAPTFGFGGEIVLEADMADLLESESKRIKEFLHKLGEKLKTAGIGGKVKSVSGSPGEGIIREAEEEKAAMIVTGTRGLGRVRRTLLGSVSDYIIHHAHIPVAICRYPEQSKHQ